MITRILPFDEWPRLVGTILEDAWQDFDPLTTRVNVVEEDGEIIGCSAVFQRWHVEGAWVHPKHRGRSVVARHLSEVTERSVKATGAKEVLTMTFDNKPLCRNLGTVTELDCKHFLVAVQG